MGRFAYEERNAGGNGGNGGDEGLFIAGHFDEPDSYAVQRPHGRDDWLMTYTIEGRGFFVSEGARSVCEAGDMVLIPPGNPQHYGTVRGERWHFVWAHFSARLSETGLLPDRPLIVHRIESDSVRTRVYGALQRAVRDIGERGPYWQQLGENAVREIVLLLAQRLRRPLDPRIEETLRLLSEGMREPLKIEELAKAVGLSPSRLSHLFKELTGHSIVETLNTMRVRQAELLLSYTDRNASEAAFDVGFANYNHFLHQFRKRVGMSPSAFRRKARQHDSN
ncbi:helix-turn-helix domain-containing protein [Paenibacillus hodogayensis]|uniref:Helix-turn-helix domain-containing protein n=1 Tax=Paenibacillus hodogayensis TaxID=279208 RepID=A0ABV5VXD9_9BACL